MTSHQMVSLCVVVCFLMIVSSAPSSDFTVRVVGGTAEAGRLEIFHDGTWNTVCDDRFGQEEALVACRMLGINSTTAVAVGSEKYGAGSGPILFSNLQCVGNETSLAQCRHSGLYRHICSHWEDVGVMCNFTEQLKARVVGGTAEAGRLEIFYDGEWSTVCREGFGQKEALVACRMLGFNSTTAVAVKSDKYGEGFGLIMFSHLQCVGNETSLAQCQHPGLYRRDCTHWEDVGVMCNFTWGEWGTWSACSATCGDGRRSRMRTCSVTHASCPGEATQTDTCNITACCVPRHGQWNIWGSWSSCSRSCGEGTRTKSRTCSGPNACGRPCEGNNATEEPCNDYVCPAQQLTARVVGGTAKAGRLEIFYNGTWNTVCRRGFGQKEALVACRMLGFNSTTAVAVGSDKYGAGSGPILFSHLRCVGNETSLGQCGHSGRYKHDCRHRMDVGVKCNLKLRARVVNGTAEAGRLEIFYRGTWNTVCQERFGQKEALVACRMLGFNSTTVAAVWSAKYGAGSGPILFSNLQCVGHETSLAQCKHWGFYIHICDHWQDVGVACNITQELRARVVGGTAEAGRLEIFHHGTWNTVCRKGFREEEALVACRMLGFNNTTAAAVWSPKYGPGSGDILFGYLRCVGNETSLAQCRHLGLYKHYCTHREDVGVSCSLTQQFRARVVGGTAEAGRLEIFYDGTWNTVCRHGFGQKEALVACRMLGFNSTTAAAVGSAKYGEGSGPVLFDRLQCVGNETSLAQCKYPGLYRHHHCRHSEDIGISCNITQKLTARVVGGTPKAGRLEILYDGTWNTVCDDGFGQEEALVACRMLGFNSTTAVAVRSNKYGPGSGPVMFNFLRCVGNETSLALCKHWGLYIHDCSHWHDVGVECNFYPPETPSLLVDNQTTVNYTTNVNNSVDFTCRVSPGNVQRIVLLKVTRNSLQILQGLSTSSLSFRIEKAGCADSGIYYCQAGNTLGQTNSTLMQLNVLCSPQWASDTLATTTELKVTEGLEGQTTFEVMASPVPSIDGFVSHQEESNSSAQEKPVRSDLFTGKCEQKTPDLHLATCTVYVTQATPTDNGLYSVHVSNSMGAMTVTFELSVTSMH